MRPGGQESGQCRCAAGALTNAPITARELRAQVRALRTPQCLSRLQFDVRLRLLGVRQRRYGEAVSTASAVVPWRDTKVKALLAVG
jgi:hypothetical protein